MKKILIASLLISAMSLGISSAQTHPNAAPSDPQVHYKQLTRYDFDSDQVEGSVAKPDTELVQGARQKRPSSLVRTRTNFTHEILKSAEGL